MIRFFFNVDNNESGGAGHIDHDKAQEHIKGKINGVKPDLNNGAAAETEMNLSEDNNLGRDPKDTLNGKIIAQKYGEEVHQKIIDFRVSIDSLYLTCKELESFQFLRSRELALAITAFQNARQHTGKLLSERGAPYPYSSADGKADRPNQGKAYELDLQIGLDAAENRQRSIVALGKLRDLAEDVITDYSIFGNNMSITSYIEVVSSTSVMKGLLDGKMWLGELVAVLAHQ